MTNESGFRWLRFAGIYLLAILVCTTRLAFAQVGFRFFEPVTPARPVQIMAHRGLKIAAPENSRAAIEMCAQDYIEWAEIDVRLSKDGHHIVIHDQTVDTTTNGNGRVEDLTLAELKDLDAGTRFARRFAETRLLTLPEALAIAKGKINLYLDCKRISPEQLVKDVVAAGMEQQVLIYDSPANLAQIRHFSKGRLAGMTKYRQGNDFDSFVKDVAPAAVEIDATEVTVELCRKFHEAGIKVQAKVLGPWDQPSVWGPVIDAGVDFLQTDDPAGLRFFIVRRQIPRFPVQIACHRGVSRYAPENTIPAIREAAKLGVDFAEIDIRTTNDGHTVLMHDGTINRTTTGQGAIREISFDQITALSAGRWFGKPYQETLVPSLTAGLNQMGDRMGVYLDAKDIAPETLIAAIQKHHLSERHVVYQSLDYCNRIRTIDPAVRIMPPLKRAADLEATAASRPYAVDTAWSILSKDLIEECHRRGIQVFSDALGPNESIEQYSKAITLGIDCIQTDHPLRLLRAIELHEGSKSSP